MIITYEHLSEEGLFGLRANARKYQIEMVKKNRFEADIVAKNKCCERIFWTKKISTQKTYFLRMPYVLILKCIAENFQRHLLLSGTATSKF